MKAKENWKPVTISGFTGIMLGAGAMYGTQKLMTGDEEVAVEAEDQMKDIAANDDLSFKEAFEAARAELGPGGVFHWRGGIYGTYYADEWNAMTDEEKAQFAQSVQQGTTDTDDDNANQLAEATVVEEEDNTNELSYTAADAEEEVVSVKVVEEKEETAFAETAKDDEDDVRIIGYGDMDLADGSSVTVEELEINGQRVAVIDVDKDGVGDFAMSDLNHNNRPDEGEVIDLHTGDVIGFDDNQTTADDVDSVIDIMPA